MDQNLTNNKIKYKKIKKKMKKKNQNKKKNNRIHKIKLQIIVMSNKKSNFHLKTI